MGTRGEPGKGGERQDPTRRLRLRLWAERAVFLAVIAALVLVRLGVPPGGPRACLVTVDGEPVTVVETRADADRMLEQLQSDSELPAEKLHFVQELGFHNVSARRNPIQSDVEAINALRAHVEVVTRGAAILANGELVIGLPTQEEAVRTLSLLLQELSPPGPNVKPFFKEKVRVEMRDVPPEALAASAEEAVGRVTEEASPKVTHEVKPGESAWQIARDYGVSLSRLAQANPEVSLDSLRAGAKLRIPGPAPALTVVARQEIEEPMGGGAGGRVRRVRVTYENGAEVKREIIGRTAPVAAAQPARRSQDAFRWRDGMPG